MKELENFNAKKANNIATAQQKEEYYEALAEIKKQAEAGGLWLDYYPSFKSYNTVDYLIEAGFKVKRVDAPNTDIGYYYKITW